MALLLYPRERKPVANKVDAEWTQHSEYFLRLTTKSQYVKITAFKTLSHYYLSRIMCVLRHPPGMANIFEP